MKLPKSLMIKGERWLVVRKTREEILKAENWGLAEGEALNGFCDFENRVICISTDIIGLELAQTYIHEFAHAVLHELHITLDRALEEAIVDGLASELVKKFEIKPKT